METTVTLQPGATLQAGKYRISRTLGQGGFGITYEAEQVLLRRKVAVKEFFMKDCCERNESTSHVTVGTGSQRALVEKFRSKFIREAQMIAGMDHPHIVRVLDVFEENDTAYYVMENLPGGSLSEKVKREGPLPEAEAVKFIRQVSSALAYIHAQNTVHLDVKPSNILLNGKGEAVLIDFGISKHYDEAGEQTSSTPVGISKGYAPLEQGRDGDVSQFKPSTDIYALGATLYHLLTGSVPPEASIVNEDGLDRPAGLSHRTLEAIRNAMQPRRKDRPQTLEPYKNLLEDRSVGDSEEDEKTIIVGNAPKSKAPEPAPAKPAPASAASKPAAPASAPAKKNINKKVWIAVAAGIVALVLLLLPEEPEPDQPVVTENKTEVVQSEPEELTSQPKAGSTTTTKTPADDTQTNAHATPANQTTSQAKTMQESPATDSNSDVTITKNGNKTTYTVKGVSFTMVSVGGGSLEMGATAEQWYEADNAERPAHNVTLRGFSIGESEVTQELWKVVMGNNPSYFKLGDKYPVEQVSYDDCKTFIRKLNELTGKTFRLPTEAEWEYAARGGRHSRGKVYAGSDNMSNVGWYNANAGGTTHPVKNKGVNELGLYDMSGNVWEWCNDWFGEYGYDDLTNPRGPSSGSTRILRGGSWYNGAWHCRVSFRSGEASSLRTYIVGFRLAQ